MNESLTIHSTDTPTTRRLMRGLTKDELREKGQELAELVGEISDSEEEKKTEMARFKEEIDMKKAEAASLAQVIRDRQMVDDVACEWIVDTEHGTKSLTRTDTGEALETKSLNLFDAQKP